MYTSVFLFLSALLSVLPLLPPSFHRSVYSVLCLTSPDLHISHILICLHSSIHDSFSNVEKSDFEGGKNVKSEGLGINMQFEGYFYRFFLA